MFISFYLIDMLVSILFQSEYKHCDMKNNTIFLFNDLIAEVCTSVVRNGAGTPYR
jgi:hypothetical protein